MVAAPRFPATERPNDIGRMEFETPDRVLEYGVEVDYFEIWERLPDSKSKTSAVQVSDDPLTLLLSAGAYAMLIRPRAMELPTASNLSAFLEGESEQILRETLNFEISFGRRLSGETWRIDLSTLPWQEGADIPMDA